MTMDNITEVSPSKGYTSILTVVNCPSKQAHFIPAKATDTSRDFVQQFRDHIFRLHEFYPSRVQSDGGPWPSDSDFLRRPNGSAIYASRGQV